jgi:hypothetical protein
VTVASRHIFRLLLLVTLSAVLFLRVGPFCEAAMAAPAAATAVEGCHGVPSHNPAPEESHLPKLSCVTPCAVLAPEIPRIATAQAPRPAAGWAIDHVLSGISIRPEAPPPRRA